MYFTQLRFLLWVAFVSFVHSHHPEYPGRPNTIEHRHRAFRARTQQVEPQPRERSLEASCGCDGIRCGWLFAHVRYPESVPSYSEEEGRAVGGKRDKENDRVWPCEKRAPFSRLFLCLSQAPVLVK